MELADQYRNDYKRMKNDPDIERPALLQDLMDTFQCVTTVALRVFNQQLSHNDPEWASVSTLLETLEEVLSSRGDRPVESFEDSYLSITPTVIRVNAESLSALHAAGNAPPDVDNMCVSIGARLYRSCIRANDFYGADNDLASLVPQAMRHQARAPRILQWFNYDPQDTPQSPVYA